MTKIYCDACGLEGAKVGVLTLDGFTFDLEKDCIAKIRAVLDGKILGPTVELTAAPIPSTLPTLGVTK